MRSRATRQCRLFNLPLYYYNYYFTPAAPRFYKTISSWCHRISRSVGSSIGGLARRCRHLTMLTLFGLHQTPPFKHNCFLTLVIQKAFRQKILCNIVCTSQLQLHDDVEHRAYQGGIWYIFMTPFVFRCLGFFSSELILAYSARSFLLPSSPSSMFGGGISITFFKTTGKELDVPVAISSLMRIGFPDISPLVVRVTIVTNTEQSSAVVPFSRRCQLSRRVHCRPGLVLVLLSPQENRRFTAGSTAKTSPTARFVGPLLRKINKAGGVGAENKPYLALIGGLRPTFLNILK